MKTITPEMLVAAQTAGEPLDILDVRTPAEFREVHAAAGVENVPLHQLDPAALLAARRQSADQPLYVMCRSGSRAAQACKRFADAGFDNVFNVEGGIAAWELAGLPVTRGKKAISIERQVRIGAGTLILLGLALAWTLHPAFAGLSGFVAAGLVFAGITDTCGMGMLLAKMPWNQDGGTSCDT